MQFRIITRKRILVTNGRCCSIRINRLRIYLHPLNASHLTTDIERLHGLRQSSSLPLAIARDINSFKTIIWKGTFANMGYWYRDWNSIYITTINIVIWIIVMTMSLIPYIRVRNLVPKESLPMYAGYIIGFTIIFHLWWDLNSTFIKTISSIINIAFIINKCSITIVIITKKAWFINIRCYFQTRFTNDVITNSIYSYIKKILAKGTQFVTVENRVIWKIGGVSFCIKKPNTAFWRDDFAWLFSFSNSKCINFNAKTVTCSGDRTIIYICILKSIRAWFMFVPSMINKMIFKTSFSASLSTNVNWVLIFCDYSIKW